MTNTGSRDQVHAVGVHVPSIENTCFYEQRRHMSKDPAMMRSTSVVCIQHEMCDMHAPILLFSLPKPLSTPSCPRQARPLDPHQSNGGASNEFPNLHQPSQNGDNTEAEQSINGNLQTLVLNRYSSSYKRSKFCDEDARCYLANIMTSHNACASWGVEQIFSE